MKIIDFLKNHPNWEKLLSNPPYSLKIKRKGNLILLNYSQTESDSSNEIVKEARGTIIEDETFKPICVGFKRFYNIDEPYAAKIDWSTAVATSKEDGTLFFIYWYNDKWHVKTRSTFDAEEAPMENVRFLNFKELFDYLISFYPNFSYDKLNRNYVYCLEGCSNFNRIVIKYDKPCLFHLMTRDMSTLQEVDTTIGIPKPTLYKFNSEKDYRELVASMSEDHEGIVIRDKFCNRVKIKTLLYFELHQLHNNGQINLERIVDLIQENDYEELLCYYPQYTDYVMKIKKRMEEANELIAQIIEQTAQWKEANNVTETNSRQLKGCFAQLHKRSKYSALYFLAYDNKITQILAAASTKKLISLLHLDENENE